MSEWLRLVNDLKCRSPVDLFTDTQRRAWQALIDLLKFPQQVNLYGPIGSGKTFVAWGVAQSLDAIHLSVPKSLDDCRSVVEIVLVDNAPFYEYDARRLIARCNLIGARSAVLITCEPITMPMRRIELPLPTIEEVTYVARSLSRLGYFQSSQPLQNPNFWDILQSFVQ